MGETAPFWRFSTTSYPDLEREVPADALVGKINRSSNGDASSPSRVYTSFSKGDFTFYCCFFSTFA